MDYRRIVIQAATAALLFFGIKLILEKSTSQETLVREGVTALVFGLAYGVYLVVRNRWRKKED